MKTVGKPPAFNFTKSFSDVEIKKILPTANSLNTEIKKILGENKSGLKINKLQEIIQNILRSYDVTGFAVYSEIRDMIAEGSLEIDNDELNNDSIIRLI